MGNKEKLEQLLNETENGIITTAQITGCTELLVLLSCGLLATASGSRTANCTEQMGLLLSTQMAASSGILITGR